MDVLIVGAGIGGLTLALRLHQAGLSCRIYEAAPALQPLGVGISLLPHGTRELAELGLVDRIRAVAVEFKESCFFSSRGQLIHREPAPGAEWPQFLIHRGALHEVLLAAVRDRLGAARLHLGHAVAGVEQDESGVTLRFRDGRTAQRGTVAIGCDGIHSALRHQFYPTEGRPAFAGINMWRGVTRHPPFLSGGSHVRAGKLATGKMVIYPIRNDVDGAGNQLVNWVAEIRRSTYEQNDWSQVGRLEDFLPLFEAWHFDWLDVPDLLRRSEIILEYPMVDRDPVPRWSFGRATLLGDAAHPMYPRGSNGASQAIIDARVLARCLKEIAAPDAALAAYEKERLESTNRIVLTNRVTPPDRVIELAEERSGGALFARAEDVISTAEIRAILDGYKRLTGAPAATPE
jgi:2-polyprenyl-6-methoxyphenol hydroxylase-like FAD-dependent oxidoreductase